MLKFDFQKRVRYAETDKMGYLYYGHYAKLYEIGRVETMRSIGILYKDLEDKERIMLPVLSLNVRYIAPAYYDEVLTIRSILEEAPEKMIAFKHEIYNEKMELINKGEVKLFFVNMDTGKRISVPAHLKEKFKAKF